WAVVTLIADAVVVGVGLRDTGHVRALVEGIVDTVSVVVRTDRDEDALRLIGKRSLECDLPDIVQKSRMSILSSGTKHDAQALNGLGAAGEIHHVAGTGDERRHTMAVRCENCLIVDARRDGVSGERSEKCNLAAGIDSGLIHLAISNVHQTRNRIAV